jgi:hypothetical protein
MVRWKVFVWALSGPVRANCDCHISLCLLLQDKVADVTKLKDKCNNWSTRGSVTIAEIAQGAACCEPPHPVTAKVYCLAMGNLAAEGSAACDKIASAGGIPVIVQLLAHFLAEEEVARMGLFALYWLAREGSASIKSFILAQPDIVALLRAASTRYQTWGEDDRAAYALEYLGV